MHGVWRHWDPPLERSKLVTTTLIGSLTGIMLGLSSSSVLVSYVHWSAPFYISGLAGILWSILWFYTSAPSPSEHRYVSNEEKLYIEESIGTVATGHVSVSPKIIYKIRSVAQHSLEIPSTLSTSLGHLYRKFLSKLVIFYAALKPDHIHA